MSTLDDDRVETGLEAAAAYLANRSNQDCTHASQCVFDNDRVETGIEEAAVHLISPAKDDCAHAAPSSRAADAAARCKTLRAAESYIRAGWKTFPGKRGNHDHRDKEPLAGWQWRTNHVSLADAPTYFGNNYNNVLVVLGRDSGNLIDLDLDWAEAGAAADVIFGDLPSFGRSGKPRSHRLARCDVKSKKFLLPQSLANHPQISGQQVHKMCIAEIRGSGGYTVFPGSEHQSGEKVEWTNVGAGDIGSVPVIDLDALHRKMGLLAFVAFCMRFFPAVGSRCDFMMAVAGTLARAGYAAETIQNIAQSIGAFNNDAGDNGSWRVASESLAGKLDNGEEITGLPTLINILGLDETVLKWCRKMLGIAIGTAGGPSINGAHNPHRTTGRNVKFRDADRFGKPKPSLANAVIACRALGIDARYDLFRNRTIVNYKGTSKTIREGSLTDQTVSAVRSLINNTFGIDCGDPHVLAAINEIARDNAYDPVLDHLNYCQANWDGIKRLNCWVCTYLGCEDTPLSRAIGRAVLIAACRRPREPGCKFDVITVLEGPEGVEKSTAIRILAGDAFFSDQSILGSSDKEIQEQLDGVWMHENADLAGIKKADVEQIKAFASRQVDRARPAYGRVREDRPRRSVEFGTTNEETYLLSQTGNRRFWPLKVGRIDVDALKQDRDQLLGEAAAYEAAGESIVLPKILWDHARNAQEARRTVDPWEDHFLTIPSGLIHSSPDGFDRVSSADILSGVLQIPKAQQSSAHATRLAKAMYKAGWDRNPSGRVTINNVPVRGYIRRTPSTANPNLASLAAAAAFLDAQRYADTVLGRLDDPPASVPTGFPEVSNQVGVWADLTD